MAKSQPQAKKETVLNRLRIGHTRITYCFLMAKENPPICLTCGTKSSVKHLILGYLKYNQERFDYNIPRNLDAAFGPDYLENINLIKILKQTNIKLYNRQANRYNKIHNVKMNLYKYHVRKQCKI